MDVNVVPTHRSFMSEFSLQKRSISTIPHGSEPPSFYNQNQNSVTDYMYTYIYVFYVCTMKYISKIFNTALDKYLFVIGFGIRYLISDSVTYFSLIPIRFMPIKTKIIITY